jgi:hypothetical protein
VNNKNGEASEPGFTLATPGVFGSFEFFIADIRYLRQIVSDDIPRRHIFSKNMALYPHVRIRIKRAKGKSVNCRILSNLVIITEPQILQKDRRSPGEDS